MNIDTGDGNVPVNNEVNTVWWPSFCPTAFAISTFQFSFETALDKDAFVTWSWSPMVTTTAPSTGRNLDQPRREKTWNPEAPEQRWRARAREHRELRTSIRRTSSWLTGPDALLPSRWCLRMQRSEPFASAFAIGSAASAASLPCRKACRSLVEACSS